MHVLKSDVVDDGADAEVGALAELADPVPAFSHGARPPLTFLFALLLATVLRFE